MHPHQPGFVFSVSGPHFGRSKECMFILLSLPDWFGIPSFVSRYAAEIDNLPTFLALIQDQVIGFISLKQYGSFSAEVTVMGVRPDAHRRGIGQALLNAAQDWLKERAVEYLQVKTLGPSKEDPNYARTRAFYLALGFRPLEEFKQIWDENNPCLLLVKHL